LSDLRASFLIGSGANYNKVNNMGLSAKQEAVRDAVDVYSDFESKRYDDVSEKWPIVKRLTINITSVSVVGWE
jgi:hypothetical protein